MTIQVAPLGLRLFLEGVEVPVISGTVSVQPDGPATAAIQVIPTDMGMNFLPRTLVHLFYLDSTISDEEVQAAQKIVNPDGSESRPPLTFTSGILNRFASLDIQYKILFTGEVIGLNYKKNPQGRQLVLQCMDLSSYWDTCYQFFSDYSAGGSGLTDKHHNFVGAGQNLFDNFGGHQWVIARLISTKPRTPEYQEAAGLLGGLIHLLEAVGGIKYRDSRFKGFKGINDFFTIAELRYNLLGMLGAIQKDKTSAKLYSSKAFNQWLRNGMTSLGTLISFRDILNHLNRFIFHNIYPNPCAHYVPGGTTQIKMRVKAGTFNLVDSVVGLEWKAEMKKTLTTINVAIVAIRELLLVGPRLEAINVSNRISKADQALRLADDNLEQLIPIVEISGTSDAKKVAEEMRDIRGQVRDAVTSMPRAQGRVFSAGGSPGGDLFTKLEKILKNIKNAAEQLDDLLGKEKTRFRTKVTDVPSSGHLFNQLFLPETFFVSPPRCNVIFPDQYFELSFSRNFMREISRLACQGGLGMIAGGRRGAKLFSRYYLAPNIKDVRGKNLRASLSQGARIILPHEIHSGIIPKFEWVTDGHRWGIKAATGAGKLKKVKKSQKINYLQRLAHFQFFLHRWSARQLNVSGLFNPNIVAGLPGVVFDRSSPSPAVVDRLEKILRRRFLPTQYLGKIHSFTHTINQSGGFTSIQYVFARTHRGLDDEFLGILNEEIVAESKDKIIVEPLSLAQGIDQEEKNFKTALQGLDPKKAKNTGIGKIFARVSRAFEPKKLIVRMFVEDKLKPKITIKGVGRVNSVSEEGGDVFLTRQGADLLGISASVFRRKAIKKTAQELGLVSSQDVRANTAVDALRLPQKIVVFFSKFRSTGKFKRSGKAFEDVIRPGWFSEDVWSNKNITEAVYKPLLGTIAITDDKSLGQDQQDELVKRWRTEVQLAEEDLLDFDKEGREERTSARGNATQGPGTAASQQIDGKYVYAVIPGSVEETIDGLALIYGMIKDRGGNIHEFIREFTNRPIANIVDILGSQNLEFDSKGVVADKNIMIEGFHSRAFGDYNTDVTLPNTEGSTASAGSGALAILMEGEANPASVKRPAIIGKDEPASAIRPELDPRGRARGRVRAYVEELRVSKGLLGS